MILNDFDVCLLAERINGVLAKMQMTPENLSQSGTLYLRTLSQAALILQAADTSSTRWVRAAPCTCALSSQVAHSYCRQPTLLALSESEWHSVPAHSFSSRLILQAADTSSTRWVRVTLCTGALFLKPHSYYRRQTLLALGESEWH